MYSDPEDERRLLEGVRLAWKVLKSPPMGNAYQRIAGLTDEIVGSDDKLKAYTRLVMSAGVDTAAAARLADKILDWREPGHTRRLNGAKAREYALAGLPYGPRGGAFQSVNELRLVMDMTEPQFERLRPALTVYSGSPSIDPQFAPPEAALAAIPTMTAQATAAAMAARARPGAGIIPPIVPLQGRAFAITIAIQRGGRPSSGMS